MTKSLRRKAKPKMGHPTLFEGPREQVAYRITSKARDLVRSTQAMLKARGYGSKATEGAALEYLIRKATRTGLRLPALPPKVHNRQEPSAEVSVNEMTPASTT